MLSIHIILSYANLQFWPIEKTKEEGEKAEKLAAGGLDDDDVWGDVEDVSQSSIQEILLTKFMLKSMF